MLFLSFALAKAHAELKINAIDCNTNVFNATSHYIESCLFEVLCNDETIKLDRHEKTSACFGRFDLECVMSSLKLQGDRPVMANPQLTCHWHMDTF